MKVCYLVFLISFSTGIVSYSQFAESYYPVSENLLVSNRYYLESNQPHNIALNVVVGESAELIINREKRYSIVHEKGYRIQRKGAVDSVVVTSNRKKNEFIIEGNSYKKEKFADSLRIISDRGQLIFSINMVNIDGNPFIKVLNFTEDNKYKLLEGSAVYDFIRNEKKLIIEKKENESNKLFYAALLIIGVIGGTR
jgi:hypothetical protein